MTVSHNTVKVSLVILYLDERNSVDDRGTFLWIIEETLNTTGSNSPHAEKFNKARNNNGHTQR